MANFNSTPRVLCAGIVVADIYVPALSALPQPGELCATPDFLLDSGGCAANVAAALARLRVPTAVVGSVGHDMFGDFVIGHLADAGVQTDGIRRSVSLGTSKTIGLSVVGQDRRFIHTFGANAEFSESDIDLDLLERGGILYLGGLIATPNVNPVRTARLFRAARERGIVTVLDVVVPTNNDSNAMAQLDLILPYTDYFTPNEEEGRLLTGEFEPLEQARRFLAAGCGTVLLTRGKHGTILLSRTAHIESGIYPVEFIDGSGSGDAFAAGWITGLVEGWPQIEALRFASAVGASACRKLGCTPGVFTRPEALTFMATHLLELNDFNLAAPE